MYQEKFEKYMLLRLASNSAGVHANIIVLIIGHLGLYTESSYQNSIFWVSQSVRVETLA